MAVTRSSDVLPQFREYERTSTTVISAYAKPVVDRYLSSLEEKIRTRGFRGPFTIVQANGGTIPAGAIRRHAAKMILSGPAAGVVGATTAAVDVHAAPTRVALHMIPVMGAGPPVSVSLIGLSRVPLVSAAQSAATLVPSTRT